MYFFKLKDNLRKVKGADFHCVLPSVVMNANQQIISITLEIPTCPLLVTSMTSCEVITDLTSATWDWFCLF